MGTYSIMRKTLILLIFCIIAAVNLYAQKTYSINNENKIFKVNLFKKKVFAHYLQWFKYRIKRGEITYDHWKWFGAGKRHNPEKINEMGFRDISSVYYPIIGVYDSEDEDVIEYHILTAKAAGIDGFIVDWYGPDNSIDRSFKKLLDISAKYDFKACICYEEKLAFPGYRNPETRQEAVNYAIQDLEYIVDTYSSDANYFKYNNLPILLMFLSSGRWKGLGNKVFKKNELMQIIDFLNKNGWMFIREHLWMDFEKLRAGFAWVGDDDYHDWFYKSVKEMKNNEALDLVIGAVNPGFNDKGVWGWGNGPRYTSRSNGRLYEDYWNLIYQEDPDMVQIVTWNDFEEGTCIAPTYQDRFFYIDKTEEYVSIYNGRKVDLNDNKLPFYLFQLRKYINKQKLYKNKNIKNEIEYIAQNLFKFSAEHIEEKLNKLANKIKYEFINYYDASDEYEKYGDHIYEETLKNIFSSKSNLAFKCKVEVSSKGYSMPIMAVDGNINTRWSSLYKDNVWFSVDLENKRKIGCIIIDWEEAFAEEYLIEASNEKTNWQTIYHKKEGKGGLDIIEFNPIESRYIRFKGIKRGTGWGYSFWEFGIFNSNPDK